MPQYNPERRPQDEFGPGQAPVGGGAGGGAGGGSPLGAPQAGGFGPGTRPGFQNFLGRGKPRRPGSQGQGTHIGPGGPGAASPSQATPESQMNDLFSGLLQRHDESWEGTEDTLRGQAAAGQRYASAAHAKMGGVTSGNWSGLQRQATLGGMQQLAEARNQWEQQRMGLERDRLGFLYRASEADKSRGFEREMTEGGYAREDEQRRADEGSALVEAFVESSKTYGTTWQMFRTMLESMGYSSDEIEMYVRQARAMGVK